MLFFYKYENWLFLLLFIIVPNISVGRCLGPEGNGVSSGEGGAGGPGPPTREEDKQLTPNKEGGSMEQAEEGRAG